MPIDISPGYDHPTMPGIKMNKLGVEKISLSDGTSIDRPNSMVVSFRPYAEVKQGEETGYIGAANFGTVDMAIPNVDEWVRHRASLGDTKPYQLIQLWLDVMGEEFTRQRAEGKI